MLSSLSTLSGNPVSLAFLAAGIVTLGVVAWLIRDAYSVVGRAFGVFGRHLGAFLVLGVLVAVPGTALYLASGEFFLWFFQQWLPAHGAILESQQVKIYALVVASLPVLPWTCAAGAFAGLATWRIYVRSRSGEDTGLGDALNFALGRWSSVIWPYSLATVIIAIGSVVVVPGILYALSFAFVVAVAADPERIRRLFGRVEALRQRLGSGGTGEAYGQLARWRQPLRGSTLLTRGRRGRIFRVFAVFLPWYAWLFVSDLALLNMDTWARYASELLGSLVGLVIALAMLELFFPRVEELEASLDAREASLEGAPGPGPGGPATAT